MTFPSNNCVNIFIIKRILNYNLFHQLRDREIDCMAAGNMGND